jgi:hypothetical protein
MEFFIKQNSELPLLLMSIVKDGRTNAANVYNAELDNAVIRFSMKEEATGIPKIIMNNAYITNVLLDNPDAPTQYYVYYKWTSRDTNRKGRYIGEFSLLNSFGELVAPIRETLYINII